MNDNNYNLGEQNINNGNQNVNYGHQTFYYNRQESNQYNVSDYFKDKSKNLGNYFIYLIIDIIAVIANIVTIVSFFRESQGSLMIRFIYVFKANSNRVFLFFSLLVFFVILVILIRLLLNKGYRCFVLIQNNIYKVYTRKCPLCNKNTSKKMQIKRNYDNNNFYLKCSHSNDHNLTIDYGNLIDYFNNHNN